jgi:hypothetical protein
MTGPIIGGALMIGGSIAGQKLGEKVFGKPKTFGPDTSIPGVTSATIKKGGKGGAGEVKVPQVDVSQALEWFGEAAKTQENYYNKGLDLYGQSLKQAAAEIKIGYQNANETLQPLSWSSNQALNESMRMMGLDPISSTINASKHAQQVGFDQNISNKIAAAEKIKDPNERAALFNEINKNMSSITGKESTYEKDLAALGARPVTFTGGRTVGAGGGPLTAFQMNHDKANDPFFKEARTVDYSPTGTTGVYSMYHYDKDKISAADKAAADWDTKQAALQAAESNRLGLLEGQRTFANQYANDFSQTYDKGYTGSEVEARVAATPGYQFQMDQGTKAIERQGAAAGMLGSGNTLTGLAKYGQGLAQNFYGVYMGNLANIVNAGSSATGMIATNQINEGKDYGNLHAAYGNAAMNTNQKIGDAYAQSLYNQGNLYAQTAQFNATMQDNNINKALDRKAAAENQQTASAAGQQNANTAASQFQYDFAKGQQAGQAFTAPLTQQSYQVGGTSSGYSKGVDNTGKPLV